MTESYKVHDFLSYCVMWHQIKISTQYLSSIFHEIIFEKTCKRRKALTLFRGREQKSPWSYAANKLDNPGPDVLRLLCSMQNHYLNLINLSISIGGGACKFMSLVDNKTTRVQWQFNIFWGGSFAAHSEVKVTHLTEFLNYGGCEVSKITTSINDYWLSSVEFLSY
jgi:hypothetical protein